nr:winged helix DNA-binding protein [Novosphingobium sp. FKTRR1]
MTVRHLRSVPVPQSAEQDCVESEVFASTPTTGSGRRARSKACAQGDGGGSTVGDAQHSVTVALARELYVARRRRGRHLSSDLFGEPTWDILLDLYAATREGRRVPTTSACIGADVPPTTALRWLRILESRGLVAREDDGRDGRRTFVYLTERGLEAMDGFLLGMLASLRRVIPDGASAQIVMPSPFLHAAE